MQYLIKVLISASVIVAITELSKRAGTFWGGVLASLPLTSVLAFVWLYRDTHDPVVVADLSWAILWLVIPSLTLFIALPLVLRAGLRFPFALSVSIAIMIVSYLVTVAIVKRFGIKI